MRFQSKSSVAYMFRNFGQLYFVTLPVALLLAFCCNSRLETDVFVMLFTGQITADNFFTAFSQSFTVLRFVQQYWWMSLLALLALVLLAIAMSLLVVKLDRHMRVGEMVALPLKRAFGLFPLMLLFLAGCFAVHEVFMLMIVGVVYMMRYLPSATAIVSIGLGLTLVARAFFTYIFCLLIITFPLKYSESYRLNVAMSYSTRVMAAKRGKLILISAIFPFARYAVMALAYFIRPLDVLLFAVVNFLLLTYVPCFAYEQYYADVGGERRDISQKIFG